jgi:hypothetical protein
LTGGTDHLVTDAEPVELSRASDESNAGGRGDELAKRRQPYVSCVHGHRVSYEEFVCRETKLQQTPRMGLL